MALVNITHDSKILQRRKNLSIQYPIEQGKIKNIIFYLHGMSDNETDLFQNVGLKELSEQYNAMIICPDAVISWYTNTAFGDNYFDYIVEELPSFIQETFNLDFSDINLYIAGISMGGYGALKVGMRSKYNIKGIIAIAPAVDPETSLVTLIEKPNTFTSIYGESVNDLDNVFKLIKNTRVPIYTCCGEDDFLIEMNQEFQKQLDKKKDYFSIVEGEHNWAFFTPNLINGIQYFLS